MYLEYQNQNSHKTLREAIEEYHRYLTHIGRQILTDSPDDTDPSGSITTQRMRFLGKTPPLKVKLPWISGSFSGPPSRGSYSKSISNCQKSKTSVERWYQSWELRSFPNSTGEINASFGQSSDTRAE